MPEDCAVRDEIRMIRVGGLRQGCCRRLAKVGKKGILGGILLLGVAAPATADYQVLLKSGEIFYARDYWLDKVDKKLIRLDIDGTARRVARDGVLYIAPLPEDDPRARIAIKRITFAPKEKLAAAVVGSSPEGDPAATTESGLVTDAAATSVPASDVADSLDMDDFWRDEAERIDEQREAAKEEVKAALAGDDLAARQQARQKILDLTEARSRLREEVRSAHQGMLPA